MIRIIIVILSACLLYGCQEEEETVPSLMNSLDGKHTGIDFQNTLIYTNEFNVYKYRNFYNGGGVSIGDINNDGLSDIYFTSNLDSNRLYLNEGNFKFRDITSTADVRGTRAWSTGTTMIDINADGYMDIYVCNSGDIEGDNKENELFINNGDLTFTESAAEYGLNDEGFSTHASFFDYDRDGDLDVYLLNNSFQAIGSFNLRKNERNKRDKKGGDKLLRNDGGTFTDVSEAAGIYGSVIGFGLGITVGDVNQDYWQDIFISNDFFERDYLYINQKDGTFKEVLTEQMKSISGASMGADMADINNDGYQDIFVTEMLPSDEERLKSVTTFEDWNKYQFNVKNGYHHQFTRNTLHLNQGNNSFSEIGRFAGVEASDWSWGALFFDINNDTHKDLFIANGIYKDLTNQDYLNYIANEKVMSSIISDEGVNYKELIDIIPSNPIPNHFYLNQSNMLFERVHQEDMDTPSFSNGAAYGDLDNDGDLDLVINNINMSASIYQNQASQNGSNYLNIRLAGKNKNINAIGAVVQIILKNGQTLMQEVQPARGFQSSSDIRLTFGLGQEEIVDLSVIWESGLVTEQKNVAANQELLISIESAQKQTIGEQTAASIVSFADTLSLRHVENQFSDFNRERLIYHMMSQESPAMAIADLNQNGISDIILTGSKGSYSSILYDEGTASEYLLQIDGDISLLDAEHTDIEIADFNGDGHDDIYLASGGVDVSSYSPILYDHLLFNDGHGGFTLSDQKLPNEKSNISTSTVTSSDIDGDGDIDLFIGERVKIGRYGAPCSSYILLNDGQGNFSDQTEELLPELVDIGMVTDAVFTDLDRDGKDDLVIIGEFMPIRIFLNREDGFTEMKGDYSHSSGWWKRLHVADINQDGRLDIIVGNHGLNSRFSASTDQPIKLYYKDFDQNGSKEGVMAYVSADGKTYPYALRHNLSSQVKTISKNIPDYETYKSATMEDIFSKESLDDALVLEANELRSMYLIQAADALDFNIEFLPAEAQLTPLYAIETCDIDADGDLDIIAGGNLYGVLPEAGIYDASYGLMMRNNGNQEFESISTKDSGFKVDGQIRSIKSVADQIFVARNHDTVLRFKTKRLSGE